MAKICDDAAWEEDSKVKTLTLEHHMAASRRGFLPMFQALDGDSRLNTGLRTGELAGLRLFTECVAPLLAAWAADDRFSVMAQLRKNSPLLKPSTLSNSAQPDAPLAPVRAALEALIALNTNDPGTRFLDVLECVAAHGLFEIPVSLRPFISSDEHSKSSAVSSERVDEEIEETPDSSPSSLQAWRAFLETPYMQTTPFAEYIGDRGPYGTHQGVKGLEFERVLVVLDDTEARGFLFSYEKLLGAKPPSE